MSAAPPPVAAIGRWRIATAPPNWYFVPNFGLRHNAVAPASNIHLNDDALLAGNRLEPYVEAQKAMLRRQFDSPVFAGPRAAPLLAGRVDESMLLLIRHQPLRGTTVLQVQTYARIGTWIGVATLTTTDTLLQQARPDYESFVDSLEIAEG